MDANATPFPGDLPDACLIARLVGSPHPAATITSIDAAPARSLPGVAVVMTGGDLGEANRLRPLHPREPLLAERDVSFAGQPVALVAAATAAQAEAAALAVEVRYHAGPATLGIEHALALQSFHGEPVSICRGDPGTAIGKALHSLDGSLLTGSQLPWTGVALHALAVPRPDGCLVLRVTAELPSRIRSAVAAATGLPESRVEVESGNMPGLALGRHADSALVAALAALAALRTRRPVWLELPVEMDLAISAKRHAMKATFEAGHDDHGRLSGVEIRLYLDGGHRPGDSETALDQALLHADGAYHVPDFRVTGQLCRTHHVTGAALPGEGAAQGAMILEEILSRVAHRLSLPPEHVREINLYREEGGRNTTPYGQPVDGDALRRVWSELMQSSDFSARRLAIARANAANPCTKRGLAVVAGKAGLGDPRAERNQAAAQVQLLVDGSVRLQASALDAGDGFARCLAEEAASRFGISPGLVEARCGDLHAIPHSTARLGCDAAGLTRRAVAEACETIKARLRPIAAQLLAATGAGEVDAESIRFAEGKVSAGAKEPSLSFSDLAEAAWRRRADLSATGHFRVPNLWWDREVGAGWPFTGYACSAAAIEVQLDAFTGEIQVLRADVVHQGDSASGASRDRSQIARALQMGLGWMLRESVSWTEDGLLRQASARDCGIPGFGDAPLQQRIALSPCPRHPAEHAAASGAEGAVFLAAAAREAAREAIRAFGIGADPTVEVSLPVPVTPAAALDALRDMSRRLAAKQAAEVSESAPAGQP